METFTQQSKTNLPPASLRLYLWFAIAVTAFQIYQVTSGLSFTVPYTGWLVAGPYAPSIFFVYLALRGEQFGLVINAVRMFLVLAIVLGVFDFVASSIVVRHGHHDNPYLRVSLWRPFFTVMIPCLWLIVLNSKAVSDYCSGVRESVGEHS